MSLLDEYNSVIESKERIFNAIVTDLFAELIQVTPVDTGNLKGAWTLNKTPSGYIISNSAEYADIVLDGYKIINGKSYGSKQLPQGISPIIAKYNIRLEEQLKD